MTSATISANRKTRWCSVAALLLFGATSASAAVVFDNTLNVQPGFGVQTSKQYGDEVSLAGSDRYVTELKFQYRGEFEPGPSAATAVIRIYANDGLSALPGLVAPRPGTLLWESSPLNIAPGDHIVALAPNIIVPDKLTWSVEFSGLSGSLGDRAGLLISDPPTIGGVLPNGQIGSYSGDYWVKVDPSDDGSWSLRSVPDRASNFYATITAIPEPSAVALAVIGLGGLWLVQRRRTTR